MSAVDDFERERLAKEEAKQRHGPIGYVKLAFIGEFTRFADLDITHSAYGHP
ncbi:MAG: hypothetical protein HQL35_15770 [Alphaproteobacteria bacterium]|nr:hypothetical protein [Alphaproteobacteria bacterium]